MTTLRWRKLKNQLMIGLCAFCVVLALIPLVSVFWLVIARGAAGLSWRFFTALPTPVGEPGGGVGNAIIGSLYIVGLASLLGIPVGVGAGIFLAERGGGKLGNAVRFTAEVLAGVPSIVLGLVAYALVVVPTGHFSAFAGAVALAFLMVPGLARSTEDLVLLVPTSLREASLALGVPQWRTSLKVVLRTAAGGLLTACLLAISRAAGETAPLLFTSFNNQYWNLSANAPTSSLTVQIFNYAVSPYEELHQHAWTAALVLLLLVALLNFASRLIARGRLGGTR